MNFSDITRMMLSSMDFFELRRTAARYSVPYKGVRRHKLVRDLERAIVLKNTAKNNDKQLVMSAPQATLASKSPQGAVSAKPSLAGLHRPLGTTRINTFSARNTVTRVQSIK